jgi:hypothetical protein
MQWEVHVVRIGDKRNVGKLKERDDWEVLGVEGRGVNWIILAQETDKWQNLLNTVISLLLPQNIGNFLHYLEKY